MYPQAQANQRPSAVVRVFEIPELADTIAVYLRPVHLCSLRSVSQVLYAAYKPHLRLQFDRTSTSSWTVFPPLCKFEEDPKGAQIEKDENDKDEHTTSNTTTTITPIKKKVEPWMLIALPSSSPSTMFGQFDQIMQGQLVRTIIADTIDNFDQLVPVLKHCPNLNTLSVSRWKQDHDVFQDLHSMIPKLECLKVAFFLSVDLNKFLLSISGAMIAATLTTMPTTTVTAETSTDSASSTIHVAGNLPPKPQDPGLRSLKTFDIEHRVPDTNTIRWDALKSALDRLPALQSLSLTGIGFRRSRGEQGALIIEDEENEHLLDNGHQRLEREWLSTHRIYPQMRSLSLLKGQCSKMNLLDLDRIFPHLTSLDIVHSEFNWIDALEPLDDDISSLAVSAAPFLAWPPPPLLIPSLFSTIQAPLIVSSPPPAPLSMSTNNLANKVTIPNLRRVPFQELERIKIMALEEVGSQNLVPQLVRSRPRLVSIETHLIALSLDELMAMGSFCSREGRLLQSCGLQPLWVDPEWTSLMGKWYEMPFLSKLRHLYIQQEMSEKIALEKTIKSLHIGYACQRDSAFEGDDIAYWNAILRRLPNLQILRLERHLRNFLLFEGLGRAPPKGGKMTMDGIPSETTFCRTPVEEKGHELNNDSLERPFLRELLVTFRFLPLDPITPPTPPTLTSDPWSTSSSSHPPPFSPPSILQPPRSSPSMPSQQRIRAVETADLDQELIGRFGFLETLHIQYARRPENFETWKSTWRPGLKVTFKERQSGSFY